MQVEINKHLLPSYFKIISFVIAGLALTSVIISFNTQLNLDPNIFLPLGKYLFLLAMVFFSFSREKNEERSFNQLRLKCLIPAIIFANIFFLFETFMELFKSVEHREFMSAFEVLLIFHIYYLVSFYYYKNK
jgi:cbb3-type cytochrome oxidase subunit 3